MATDLEKTKTELKRKAPAKLEPTWEIARLFPAQGDWSEQEYLALDTNHLVEYSDGFLDFLPTPTGTHQLILQFLFKMLDAHVNANSLGKVFIAAYKVRLRAGKYREPDILFIKAAHRSRITDQYCEKADLVLEIVSKKNQAHDIETKRIEYATAGIPEYWIVDPEKHTITVLFLKTRANEYTELGTFPTGIKATSKLLPGFAVDVATVFSQQP